MALGGTVTRSHCAPGYCQTAGWLGLRLCHFLTQQRLCQVLIYHQSTVVRPYVCQTERMSNNSHPLKHPLKLELKFKGFVKQNNSKLA